MAEVIPCRPCMDTSSCGNSSSVSSFVVHHRQGQGSTRPKWRAYSKRRTRRKSFDGAAVMLVQRANYFSKIGFFYKGYGKQIVCFQCGVELEVKEGVHDYLTEHSDLAPQCPFVRQLNEDGQSDETDSEDQNDHQISNTTRHTVNGVYGRNQSSTQARFDASQTYVYDSEDPINTSHDQIMSQDLDISVSHDQDISYMQNQDISVSMDHDSTPHQQYKQTWDDQLTCKVCLSEQVSVTFRPCGHLATCRECANRLHKCPVCRAFITEKINTFLS